MNVNFNEYDSMVQLYDYIGGGEWMIDLYRQKKKRVTNQKETNNKTKQNKQPTVWRQGP